MSKKILCTICARGGSKGLKNKNIKLLLDKPLIAHTIAQAGQSGLFEHIVISTDSNEIAQIAKKYGGEVFFTRDATLASDNAGKLAAIQDAFIRSEAHYNTQFDYLIDLDATAPLRKISDIQNAFEQLINNNNTNLITGVTSRKSPYFNLVECDENNKVKLSKQLDKPILRRQDAPKCYDMNASIYIWNRDTILNQTSIFLESTGLYEMDENSLFDIDTELDFKIVEMIMKEKYD